jgi:hypothetical protein
MDRLVPMQEAEILEAFHLLGLSDEETRSRLRRQTRQPKIAAPETYTDSSTTVVSPSED